jgi:hypothetical protein
MRDGKKSDSKWISDFCLIGLLFLPLSFNKILIVANRIDLPNQIGPVFEGLPLKKLSVAIGQLGRLISLIHFIKPTFRNGYTVGTQFRS